MADHDDDGALNALQRQGPDPEHHEPQVAHRRIRDEFLEVRLHQRHQRTVNDSHHGKRDDDSSDRGVECNVREEGYGKPQETVRTHLQEDSRQDDRSGGRRLNVRVGQPGVKREHGDLDGERQEKGAEQPEGPLSQILCVMQQMAVTEGVLARLAPNHVIHDEDRHQHEQRPEKCEHEKLYRSIDTSCATPHPDDEIHRDQHDLPEYVKQEHVEGNEYTQHAGGEHQHEGIERAFPLLDVVPATEDRERHHEGGEQHHEQGDAVNAQVICDPPRRDPLVVDLELHRRRALVERPPQPQRQDELDEREPKRDLLRLCARPHHDNQSTEQGYDHDGFEHPLPVPDTREESAHLALTPPPPSGRRALL